MSESGTTIPSSEWSASVPPVPQGKYLWTRITQTYNTGAPVVSYSVSRMGMDGAGSVSSVNSVSPNSEGNVVLTPDDVGAASLDYVNERTLIAEDPNGDGNIVLKYGMVMTSALPEHKLLDLEVEPSTASVV